MDRARAAAAAQRGITGNFGNYNGFDHVNMEKRVKTLKKIDRAKGLCFTTLIKISIKRVGLRVF